MSSTLKTTYLLIMFVVDTEVVKMFISLHTASISRDFPVPLGPNRRMPRGKGSPENKSLYLILEMFQHDLLKFITYKWYGEEKAMESFFGHFHLSILYPIQVYKNKNLHVYMYYNIPAIKIMGWG